MSVAALLKGTANTFMAATLVKRVVVDVVRDVPYPAMGAAALLGALLGASLARRQRRAASKRI